MGGLLGEVRVRGTGSNEGIGVKAFGLNWLSAGFAGPKVACIECFEYSINVIEQCFGLLKLSRKFIGHEANGSRLLALRSDGTKTESRRFGSFSLIYVQLPSLRTT